jgi:hypothetical protein
MSGRAGAIQLVDDRKGLTAKGAKAAKESLVTRETDHKFSVLLTGLTRSAALAS